MKNDLKAKNWIQNELLDILLKEADELTAIFTSTLITMNRKKGRN